MYVYDIYIYIYMFVYVYVYIMYFKVRSVARTCPLDRCGYLLPSILSLLALLVQKYKY
jgi:hypothetical protein